MTTNVAQRRPERGCNAGPLCVLRLRRPSSNEHAENARQDREDDDDRDDDAYV